MYSTGDGPVNGAMIHDPPVTLAHDATTLLQRLIRLDTVNPPGNERPAQELLRDELEASGFECELLGVSDERPNLVARLRGASDGRRLCYLGHVDTVLADAAEWSVDPWSGELREGHVWGRGALDMKGQVACEVAAACALGRSGWRPASGELLVIATCDEEAGATIGAQWLCEHVPEKVRCDMVVNEGAGEVVDYQGRRLYTLCVGEKGVFRFRLSTVGRAGHASMPAMGDNALLRMIDVLGRLDGRQPEPDRYEAGVACLEVLLGSPADDVAAALARVREVEPRLAALLDPMMGVTIAPTMIRASEKENVIPSRCTVRVDCRAPPGMGEDHVRQRVTELLGDDGADGYSIEFGEQVVGNSSSPDSRLASMLRDFVERIEPGAEMLPVVLPGFTDSHWFRKAFPECVAYGFFPQRAMTRYDTMPLIHAPDERIRVEDIDLASRFFNELAPAALG
jgi:acetylornithine deacetylase/succinyl-diaminopimelate desuccinylase-like protein